MNRAKYSSTHNMFSSLGSHYVMWRSFLELYNSDHTMFPISCSHDSMKEP